MITENEQRLIKRIHALERACIHSQTIAFAAMMISLVLLIYVATR